MRNRTSISRRQFLSAILAGPALPPALARASGVYAASQDAASLSGAQLIATVPLDFPAAARAPLETTVGSGLDGFRMTNLAALTADRLVTSNESFFVRTTAPPQLPNEAAWSIAIGGLVRERRTISIDVLRADSKPAGTHLLECSGNPPPVFAMISAAAWDGVPLAAVIDRAGPSPAATHLLVSGVDDMQTPSTTSVPGASWIFARADLERAGAFLATRMNGAPLPRDHGAPVRLVVPGWYGCSCIKWVNEISLVNDSAAATTQMREFAARTHQNGVPARASDFTPAMIDTAAMPIRVEQWIAGNRLFCRVVGIIWGGAKPRNDLIIRFKPDQPFVPVSDCPLPASTTTWSLWSHVWRPAEPGRYQIVLKIKDPSVRTRRLDLYFYTRTVTIERV